MLAVWTAHADGKRTLGSRVFSKAPYHKPADRTARDGNLLLKQIYDNTTDVFPAPLLQGLTWAPKISTNHPPTPHCIRWLPRHDCTEA